MLILPFEMLQVEVRSLWVKQILAPSTNGRAQLCWWWWWTPQESRVVGGGGYMLGLVENFPLFFLESLPQSLTILDYKKGMM